MNTTETTNEQIKSYVLFPTLTSSINIMDFSYHPKLEIGVMTGDKDLKGVFNYNIENRNRVLLSMDELLKKDLEVVTFEQVSAHFSDKTLKLNDIHEDIISLNNLFTNHRNRQKEKNKLKMAPMPSPKPSIDKEEEKKKNLLKMNPFVIPSPKPL